MDFTFSPRQSEVQLKTRAFAQTRIAPLSREMDEQGKMPLSLVNEMGDRLAGWRHSVGHRPHRSSNGAAFESLRHPDEGRGR